MFEIAALPNNDPADSYTHASPQYPLLSDFKFPATTPAELYLARDSPRSLFTLANVPRVLVLAKGSLTRPVVHLKGHTRT